MKGKPNHITVYEHQALWTHKGEQILTEDQLYALQGFYGDKGVLYYDLIHKGIRFKEYVGVLQVGKLTIEVLPKADKYTEKDEWRKILIAMLHAVGVFNIHAPSLSSLTVKTNFILDLYLELYIQELEHLLHKGLIKKYRSQEGNQLALKGSLKFSKHIQQNLVHQERFYTQHTTFDRHHQIHQILYKALRLLKTINNNIALHSRIGSLLLDFPEMTDIKVTASTFNKLVFDRKTATYKNALEIAKLLLLNYHPDLSKGQHHVLALLFDMNALWEKFVYITLRKKLNTANVKAQSKKLFWKPENGRSSSIKPDIVIHFDNEKTIVLDTKWKNIGDKNPSPEDLRQLYVYHEYFNAQKVALVYPGSTTIRKGQYYHKTNQSIDSSSPECCIISIPTHNNIVEWQKSIYNLIFTEWINYNNPTTDT